MEEVKFDRQLYTPKSIPPGGGGSSILGPIILLFTVALVGIGGFLYYTTFGLRLPQTKADPQMQEIATRMEEMTARLEQLEKRLRITPPPSKMPPSSVASPAAGSATPRASRGPVPRNSASASRSGGAMAEASPPAAAAIPEGSSASRSFNAKELEAMKGDLNSSREAWEAATNRLGSTVGELGEQRRELADTRASVTQMQREMERSYLPFELDKNGGRQRVGPVWMDLRGVDRRALRFTMRLYFDDRWVEVKDRALGERVDFYVAGHEQPLELVVSDIRQDQISGRLAIPMTSPGQR